MIKNIKSFVKNICAGVLILISPADAIKAESNFVIVQPTFKTNGWFIDFPRLEFSRKKSQVEWRVVFPVFKRLCSRFKINQWQLY